MTKQEVIAALRAKTPFEGSKYERFAHEVYADGLTAFDQGYESLDDAESDWRAEYEADLSDLADDVLMTSDPGFWSGR